MRYIVTVWCERERGRERGKKEGVRLGGESMHRNIQHLSHLIRPWDPFHSEHLLCHLEYSLEMTL